MGMHSMSNSNTKRNLYNSKFRVNSLKRKQRKRLQRKHTHKEGYVDPVDLQLMHEFHSKKRIQGASANVALSGKKRRKLLRASRRIERERLEKARAEEAEAEEEGEAESASTKKPKKVRKVRDVAMEEAAEETDSESESEEEMES